MIMGAIALSNEQLFWLIAVAIVCILIAWCVAFWCLRGKADTLKALLLEGNLIRLLTVLLIVFATTILAILGVLNEAVSAIFAGIVGYVLGSMRETKSA
jgi:hypothetical protein